MTQIHQSLALEVPIQSLGTVIDQITILTRKLYFNEEEAYQEYEYLLRGLGSYEITPEILAASIKLAQMNFEIWNLENEIRRGGEDKLGLEEVGRRAIQIRNLNRKRIKHKNTINQIAGSFKEVKVNHASQ